VSAVVSPYASSLGWLKAAFPAFLKPDVYRALLAAKDVDEFAKVLDPTPYGPALARTSATHSGVSLVEIALNRTLVQRNRNAYHRTPYGGQAVVAAYLARWDIQNIELILSSKAQGRAVTETEDHLVSARDIPAGFYTGLIGLDDFRILLSQPSLDATVAALVKYGYGATILPFLEEFQRTRNIFPILQALDKEYYRKVLSAARFVQGDEWILHGFLQSELDVRNALILLKGKSIDLPLDAVLTHWIEGGTLAVSQVPALYAAAGVPDLARRLAPRWPSLAIVTPSDAEAPKDTEPGTLTGYEVAMQRDRAATELKRLPMYPLSVNVVFSYLLRVELEWSDLRRIVFGLVYGLPTSQVEPLLISHQLRGTIF
jgi:V/A-type H+/Na+-transporting ATPase subunit C